jgi:hypothetical protein
MTFQRALFSEFAIFGDCPEYILTSPLFLRGFTHKLSGNSLFSWSNLQKSHSSFFFLPQPNQGGK